MLFIIPQLILLLTSVECNHTNTNKTEYKDVIVTYSKHVEAEFKPEFKPEKVKPKEERKPEVVPDKYIIVPEHIFDKKASIEKENEANEERDSNEVVFIPNEREVVRNRDFLTKSPTVREMMEQDNIMTINDVMMDNRPYNIKTEPPVASDVIFLTGKNSEHDFKETERDRTIQGGSRRSGKDTVTKAPILNCSNLDCNNTVDSVCGAKLERRTWKYRLFLNECYYRKVNCYFKNEYNRYRLIPLDNCQNAGVHSLRSSYPQPRGPMYYPPAEKPVKVDNTRRSYPSRRSLTLSVDGQACAHACPASCPDDYAPECAVSGRTRRVFVNHCKLDYNSCAYNMVWHKRPLSECVGGKRADMQQNRAFIDWMQRVGIVDNKGKLVLS